MSTRIVKVPYSFTVYTDTEEWDIEIAEPKPIIYKFDKDLDND
jgi:hypothetical protein